MGKRRLRRRRLLAVGAATLAGGAGCVATDGTTSPGTGTSGESGTTSATPSVAIADVSVSDYVVREVVNTYPRVYRERGTQYVVVRSPEDVREGLTLKLDSETVPPASAQPIQRPDKPVEVAFGVPEDRTTESGRLHYDGNPVRELSASTIERLNHPSQFEMSTVRPDPDTVSPNQRTTVALRFTVSNVGEGHGTFAANVADQLQPTQERVTADIDAGKTVELAPTAVVVNPDPGTTAELRLHWGSDGRTVEVAVVDGTATTAAGGAAVKHRDALRSD